MVFVGRGVQVQVLLKSLAVTFADEFIAQAETRAEKLGSSLGVIPSGTLRSVGDLLLHAIRDCRPHKCCCIETCGQRHGGISRPSPNKFTRL
jgi:hypothetical protein